MTAWKQTSKTWPSHHSNLYNQSIMNEYAHPLDEDMMLLLSTIEEGMPDTHFNLPPSLGIIQETSLYDRWSYNLHKRIDIPSALRQDCLLALHTAHQSTSSISSRAEASIFWPGITSDISSTRTNCSHCNRISSGLASHLTYHLLGATAVTAIEYLLAKHHI